MADTKTDNASKSADTPAKAIERAVDAAPKAAEKAAPAELKDVAKATAQLVTAPAKAMAKAAQEPAPARRKPATRKPAARKAAAAKSASPAKKSAPARRKAAPAATKTAKRAPARAAAKTITSNMNEGNRNMKNETKQVADRIQAVFGDVNARAKTAIERNSRVAEELTEFTKGNVEAMVASTKVAAKGVETLGQEFAGFSRKSFEDASVAMKGIADVKSPTDFFRLQSDFARGQFDLMVAETSKLSETMIKLAGQTAEPITGRYSVAAERVRTAVAA